jgi:hypothetical protein
MELPILLMIFVPSNNVQTGSGAHPASHLASTGVLYQVYGGIGVLLTTHLAEVENEWRYTSPSPFPSYLSSSLRWMDQLYLYSPPL